jgi:hypothetical protein
MIIALFSEVKAKQMLFVAAVSRVRERCNYQTVALKAHR